MKFIKQLFIVIALLSLTPAFAEPVAGKDYQIINPPQPTHSSTKIEVLEFFFYGCPHCYNLNQLFSPWEKKLPKDVEVFYVPAIFNSTCEVEARSFYALEAMGQRARLHDDLFNAWHDNIELADEASTTDFLAKHGVDRKKFGENYNSFSMQSKVEQAKQIGRNYGLRGTPTLIVDGKYLIANLQPADIMQVLNALIDKARKERKH